MKKNKILMGAFVCLFSLFGSVALAQQQNRISGSISLSLPSPAENAYVSVSYVTDSSPITCLKGGTSRGDVFNFEGCNLETMPNALKVDVILSNPKFPKGGIGYTYTVSPDTEKQPQSCDFNLKINNLKLFSKPVATTSEDCKIEQ